MIKRQVVVRDTDAIVGVVVTDAGGYMSAPVEEGESLAYNGHVIVRLQVGREVFDAEYNGTVNPVVKDAWIELGTVALKYVKFEIPASETGVNSGDNESSSSSSSESESSSSSSSEDPYFYRLPRLTDDVDMKDLPMGNFLCFKVKVKRGTFKSCGGMKVALCKVGSDGYFDDGEQRSWSKLGETNIVVSDF